MTMKSIHLLLFIATCAVAFTGCATSEAKLSPMQVRQITTRQLESTYENVYRASMTVLQDQGYVVKNTDMASGLIAANIDRSASKSSQFWQIAIVGDVYDKGTFIEVTITVAKINDTLQEIRMNVQETGYNEFGGKTNVKQIADPKFYDALANQINIEVKRREAFRR
jgi:hypothetical protein